MLLQSARAGLLPGQTLPGQLRKSAEMLGDTALHSSGGLHTLDLIKFMGAIYFNVQFILYGFLSNFLQCLIFPNFLLECV